MVHTIEFRSYECVREMSYWVSSERTCFCCSLDMATHNTHTRAHYNDDDNNKMTIFGHCSTFLFSSKQLLPFSKPQSIIWHADVEIQYFWKNCSTLDICESTSLSVH